MRIPSGKTNVYLYFVAVDATDLKTRETGLSGFTVYRSRNGVAEVAYTTPTVTEIDATNMPGVYALLIDEDTTITSGADSEEVCVHITATGMAPVTRTFELYRREVTSGETLTVASGNGAANVTQFGGSNGTFASGRPEVNTTHAAGTAWNSGAVAAATIATGAITNAKFAAGAIDAAAIADNAIDAGAIATGAITNAKFAAGAIDAAAVAADAIGASELATDAVTEIAAGVWDRLTSALSTASSIGKLLVDNVNATISSRLPTASYTAPLDAAGTRSAIGLASANLDTQLTAIDDYIDTEVAAIKAKTDQLTFTTANRVDCQVYGMQADTITSSAVAASAVTEIQAGLSTLDAAGVRTAVGLASANLDTQLSTIDTVVDAILVDTGTTLDGKIDTIDGIVDSILVDTAEIGAAGAGLTAVPWNAAWDAEVQSEVTDGLNAYDPPTKAELDAAVANVSVDEIQASALADLFNTDSGETYGSAVAGSVVAEIADNAGGGGGGLDAAGVRAAVGLASANLDTQLAKLDTIDDFLDTEIAAIKAKTDNLPSDPADASVIAGRFDTLDTAVDAIPTANENADALLDRAAGVETNRTLRQAMRLMLASLVGKLSGAGTTEVTIRDSNDGVDRIVATVDGDGNRTAVTLDAS